MNVIQKLALLALFITSTSIFAADKNLSTGTINVISSTPLPSIGLPLNIIPANIQIINPKQINNQTGISIADYMMNNAQGVTFNEYQGNPFQPDVNFRGFTASPLLGTPQGMSVFVDGVRVNEPFGDVVNWDLIPNFTIGGMQIVPGSNPIYGLNTLGGAISIQTKDGRTNRGAAIEAEAGSWGRQRALAEFGGVSQDGSMDYYLGAQHTTEDGWRKYSPSHVNQTFGKLGWQSEQTKFNLSYIGAHNKMTGNGLTPADLLGSDRDGVHTTPDITDNYLHHFALNGAHWLNNDTMLSGNAFHRKSNRHTVNGDLNDDFDEGALNNLGVCDPTAPDPDLEDENCAPGAMNRSKTKQNSFGFNLQLAFDQVFLGKKNQFIVGTGFEHSKINFNQTKQISDVDDVPPTQIENGIWFTPGSRVPINLGAATNEVMLSGRTKTYSLFATDTLSMNNFWHVTGSARYNYTEVKNTDAINPTGNNSLAGNHSFNRINPSLGLTYTPTEQMSIYGSYSESSRAPTSMELGCANPAVPCKLPNAMAGDPHLDQVVVKTYEAGLRDKINDNLRWNASIYQSMNYDDIHFVSAGAATTAGFFKNVGRTKRQGFDLGLNGSMDKFSFNAGYSLILARYDSDLTLGNEVNSASANKSINVKKGDYLASIPKHQLKLRGQYEIMPQWSLGVNVTAFSGQYVQGNENNKERLLQGKLPGYAIVNLDTQYKLGQGWNLFAKAINIFDQDYNTAGRLAQTHIGANGQWDDNERKVSTLLPGAPRAGWIGVRYEFGGESKKD